MLYFFSGNDWFRREREVRKLREDFVAHFREAHTHVFSSEDFPTKFSLLRDLLSGGLFTTPTSIVIRLDEELIESAKNELRQIVERALSQETGLVIVTTQGKAKKSDALFGWLFEKATTKTIDRLEGIALEKYAGELLKDIDPKQTIEKEAMHQLLLNTRGESGLLFYELGKLSLYCEEKMITLADVKELSREPLQSEVFGALDALVRGNREQATTLLRKEEKMGVPAERTLGLMAWQLRRLIEIQELFQSGTKTAPGIAKELGMKSDFTVRKALPQLSLFPLTRLKRGMSLLADLDLATKTGAANPGVGLDLFIWKF